MTAAQDLFAAESMLGYLERDAWFVDVNSVSPSTKGQVSELIESDGGRYVEAAIMSPIGPGGIGSPILLGGPHAEAFLPLPRRLGFSGTSHFSPELGRAAAAKMCRSVLVKGLEALVAESLLAARYFRVEDTVLNSLRDLLPAEDWSALAQYMISRSLLHGERRAEEMEQVARTVEEAGVQPWMSAYERRRRWAGEHQELARSDQLNAILDGLLNRLKCGEPC